MSDFKQYTEQDPEYRRIIDHSRDLKNLYNRRNLEYAEYERMFNMKWACDVHKLDGPDTIKVTTSPTARNKVLGAWRLLISQEPKFRLRSDAADRNDLEGLEKFVSSMWRSAGKFNGRPLHHDIILSMLLYGEAHIGVNTLQDFKEFNQGDKRIDRAMTQTPIIFDVWNPKTGYPEFDKFGLSAYYREVEVDKSWVRTNYKALIDEEDKNRGWALARYLDGAGKVTLKTYYDLNVYCVHINDRLILCREHGLPVIPVSVAMSDGSNLFEDVEDNRQPMLYTLNRSRLWERENLYLTVTSSNLFSLGCMPMLAFTHDQGSQLKITNDAGMLVADIARGDSLDFVQSKGFLTAEMQNMGKMYADYIDESTVFDNAFGESSGNGSFSETSLLSVSARLPLVASQRQCGMAIAGAAELALLTMKERKIRFKREDLEVDPKKIPGDLEIECKLDMTQPQERLQRANEAAVILNNRLASLKWTQENTIGIENTEEMEREMLGEKINQALTDQTIQEMMEEEAQRKQQAQAQKDQQLQDAITQGQQIMNQPQEQSPLSTEQTGGMDMGGAQNIPAGQQIEADILAQIQQQAMMNNMNPSGMPQMMEGQAGEFGGGGIAGGLPPEMAGMMPGTGMQM